MTYSTRDACSKTSRSQEKHLSPAGSAREESSSPFFFIILTKFYAPFRAQIALRKAKEFEAEREAVPVKALINRPVVGVQVGDSVGKAIGLMRRGAYSQLPVFEGDRVVGSISEGSVTEYLAEGKNPACLPKAPVSELMEEAFPQVGEETPREVVVSLLCHVPAVLVMKEGRVTGIVTNADLFKVVRSA